MSYVPLSTSSHHGGMAGSSDSALGPVDSEIAGNATSGSTITIYVLHKEKKVVIELSSLSCTLLELKRAIELKCEVPEAQQRLIRNGKMLKALTSTLAELDLTDECTVHLFPIPQAVASPVASDIGVGIGASLATNVQGMPGDRSNSYPGSLLPDHVGGGGPPLQIVRGETLHLNPWFQNTCREVQMWSMILMVLSLLTLTNNLSSFMGTGDFGESPLDKAVFILDTIVSAGGLYVGKIGLVASRTLEAEDVKKYVVYLGILSVLAIVMRIMWVFDVVDEIKKAVHQAQADAADASRGDGNKDEGDDPISSPTSPVSDDMITTVTMQAIIISLIIILAWSSCLIRAVRLRWALRIYDRVNSRQDTDASNDTIEGIVVVNPVNQGARTAPSNV